MLSLYYRSPRLLVLTVALILVSGLSSYQVMPRLEDPVLRNRVSTVTTRLPGAGAERVEALVTEKLESKIREIEQVRRIDAQSRSGLSYIVIELHEFVTDVDEVWSRVRNKVDDARPELPAQASEPELETPDFKAYAMIVALVWQHDEEPDYGILRRNAEQLEDLLLGVPGTEKTEVYGDPEEEIVVEVQADRLATLGLTAQDIAAQLRASDAKVTAGQMRGARDNLLLEIDSELDSLARIARTPVRYAKDGPVVPLGDIAEIRQTIAQPPSELAIINGRPAVVVGAMVQKRERIDRWTAKSLRTIEEFSQRLSGGLTVEPVFIQNRYVETRLFDLLANLLFGAVAVVAVMVVMMGWRSALIVGSALPLTALLVLSGLRLLGIPIQQMSVTGLVIALGLLIDNAIVMVDNVRERLRGGLTGEQAVRTSVRHLAVPLFGSTLTTALAFMPLALLPGGAGEFVGAIAVSVILAIFGSFVLSLTVIPALTAWADRLPSRHADHRWWNQGISSRALVAGYRRTLEFVFGRPVRGILLGMLLPLIGYAAFPQLTEQFFPPSDRDQARVQLKLASHASIQRTLQRVGEVRDHLLADPNVERVDWFLGRSAPAFYYNMLGTLEHASYYAEAMVTFASNDSVPATIRRLQRGLDESFPGTLALVKQLEQGPPFEAPVEVRLYGPDLDVLRAKGEQLRGMLAEIPTVTHTAAGLTQSVPQLALRVDEEQARLSGLDHVSIADHLNTTLEGAVGGSVLQGTEQLPVRVRVDQTARGQYSRIVSLNLQPPRAHGETPSLVPLETIADVALTPELATIPRRDGQRVNVVQAYIAAGVLPGEVLAMFQESLARSDFQLPGGYRFEYGGEAAERNDAVNNLMANVTPLLVIMLATLVLSFSSFRLAGVIGAVGGLSVGLGMAMLWLFGYPFGFMAIIGTMGLVGVAINDSIVVLAALREDSRAWQGDAQAVGDVVVRSTRHVMATSFTTMAGFMPLLLDGGPLWPPLAITIAGGVLGATLLALYFTPSAYLLVMGRVRCARSMIDERSSRCCKDAPNRQPQLELVEA